VDVLAEDSLTMTAFSPITGAPAFTLSNLISGTLPKFITGDDLNGNVTPFEIGTMTIVNNGTGPGDVTLSSDSIGGNYLDTNFNERNSGLQTVAIEAPYPSRAPCCFSLPASRASRSDATVRKASRSDNALPLQSFVEVAERAPQFPIVSLILKMGAEPSSPSIR